MLTITVPWPKRELSPNFRSRTHWAKTRAVAAYRKGCGWEAVAQGAKAFSAGEVGVVVTFCPPDRRARDLDNMIASFKAGQDGIADAIGVPDERWNTKYAVGEPVKMGRVVVEIRAIGE